MKVIALIPARGGSKGLPKKNIKNLAGKPLINWSIEQALRCEFFNRVVVSTDDEEIASIASLAGAEVPFLRPPELAQDVSLMIDTVLHAIDFYESKGEYFETCVLVEPTSPLRKKDDFKNSMQLFQSNYSKIDGVISVGEIHLENPYVVKIIEDKYITPLIETRIPITQRQQYPKVYFPYGIVLITRVNILKEKRTFYTQRILPYFIERWQNYEIDDIYDFIIIETILNFKKHLL